MTSFTSTLKEYINSRAQVIHINGPDHNYIKDCILAAGLDLKHYVFFWDRVQGIQCISVNSLVPSFYNHEEKKPGLPKLSTFDINSEDQNEDEEVVNILSALEFHDDDMCPVPDHDSLIKRIQDPNLVDSERALFKLLQLEGYEILDKNGNKMRGDDMCIPKYCSGEVEKICDEGDILDWYTECPYRKMVLVVEDPSFGISGIQENSKLISQIKLLTSLDEEKVLVILTTPTKNSVELSPDVVHLQAPYPDKEALLTVFHNVITQSHHPPEDFEECDDILDSLKGLTIIQAKQILLRVLSSNGHIKKEDASLLNTYKKDIINGTGLLEYVETTTTIKDLGGLDNLKNWLISRKNIDLHQRKQYNIEHEKGIILLGPPGTGKSLGAMVAASIFNRPLIRFDVSKVFDQWVGLSEQNMRKALANIEVMTPCVLLCDEIEKALSGSRGTTESSAATPRVFGIFLDWLSQKHEGIFVIAVGNSLSSLPPEFSRKGRFDEIFYVTYPGPNARKEILDINFRKHSMTAFDDIHMETLIAASSGFSGAEIEGVINEAIIHCLSNQQQIDVESIVQEFKSTIPQSGSNSAMIQYYLDAGTQMATPASSEKWDGIAVPVAVDESYR